MIEIDGKQYRNLEEQVLKNQQDIYEHYAVDRIIADFGIHIIGNLPDASYLAGRTGKEYGDAYAIGTEPPYTFYVWTRADEASGHSYDYWFNIGKLAVQGPQGPIGPQGPRGIEGERGSIINIFFGADGVAPMLPGKANDIAINATNGDLWQLGASGWARQGNIRGARGGTGPMGPAGPVGPVGPQGPQGPQGPMGRFVHLEGIVTSSDQLISPAELNDLSISYLVGQSAPYDLYVQIGPDPQTAIWYNMGPLNYGTLVYVSGSAVAEFNADTKLDKHPDGLKIYATNEYGETTHIGYSVNGGSNNIPRADQYGNLRVPVDAPLIPDGDKSVVLNVGAFEVLSDELLKKKVTRVNQPDVVVYGNHNSSDVVIPAKKTAGSNEDIIPIRTVDGNIVAPSLEKIKEGNYFASTAYVKDEISKIPGGGSGSGSSNVSNGVERVILEKKSSDEYISFSEYTGAYKISSNYVEPEDFAGAKITGSAFFSGYVPGESTPNGTYPIDFTVASSNILEYNGGYVVSKNFGYNQQGAYQNDVIWIVNDTAAFNAAYPGHDIPAKGIYVYNEYRLHQEYNDSGDLIEGGNKHIEITKVQYELDFVTHVELEKRLEDFDPGSSGGVKLYRHKVTISCYGTIEDVTHLLTAFAIVYDKSSEPITLESERLIELLLQSSGSTFVVMMNNGFVANNTQAFPIGLLIVNEGHGIIGGYMLQDNNQVEFGFPLEDVNITDQVSEVI